MSGRSRDERATAAPAAVAAAVPPLMGVERVVGVVPGGGGGAEALNGAAAPPVRAPDEPPRKRTKLDEAPSLRKRVLEYKLLRLKTLRDRYTEQLSELYFLQAGGNMMDYAAWRKRPPAPQLAAFLEARRPPPVPPPDPPAPDPPPPTEMVEKARQEAYVAARVAELARAGLWAERRLPRVCEPPRPKTHWDYLLEEMAWLAQDFAHERKWKKQAAKKCARAVQKYFQDKAAAAQKAEKAQELQLKRIAAFAAKEIRTFWLNVEKLVEWKRSRRVERARKEALDEQLSIIVDRTEQYSRQLAASLQPQPDTPPSDDEFTPRGPDSDDEETIAQAEQEAQHDASHHRDEIEALRRESRLALPDLLPPGYTPAAPSPPPSPGSSDYSGDADSADDENTIAEQERRERTDHKQEIDELQEEADLDIEELRRRYAAAPPPPPPDADSDSEESEREESDDSESASSSASGGSEKLATLVDDPGAGSERRVEAAASLAATLQPTGTTLQSTAVATPVPRLLKHPLREYQHVGLHWLATMHARALNGILADEMGLGKTIQTIALLAHLALERQDWGPHLVVAPTSVVLNWEMEFKKWCPAFKILTYYGTIKERKLKRVGWTKPNSFHVCITSYKLVVQDHQSFRRKRWRYLVLDEAQNIKNFKSQRWQMLLNFQTDRRLLLTGTPLQNSLLELWSLMHFLMPDVFASHSEFREWFAPVAALAGEGGAGAGTAGLVRRLHEVLRPFLLRRLKADVERQMPRKYEHVLLCRLAKRQRCLYDDFMARAKTKESLASGNLLSVINVLMQLRKVCNHPDLFEPRAVASPFHMDALRIHVPAVVLLDEVGILYNTPTCSSRAPSPRPSTWTRCGYTCPPSYYWTRWVFCTTPRPVRAARRRLALPHGRAADTCARRRTTGRGGYSVQHPDLFVPRAVASPFHMDALRIHVPAVVLLDEVGILYNTPTCSSRAPSPRPSTWTRCGYMCPPSYYWTRWVFCTTPRPVRAARRRLALPHGRAADTRARRRTTGRGGYSVQNPDLFEPRAVASPFHMDALRIHVPAVVLLDEVRERIACAARLGGDLASLEASEAGAFAAHRARHLAPPRRMVEELCAAPPPAPPRPPEAKLRIHLRLVPRALPPAALGAVRRAAARPAAPARGQAADTPAARAARAAARRAGSVYRLVAGGHRRAAWWRSCAPRRRPPRRARPRPSCGYTCGSCRARCRPPRWELCAAPPPAPPRPPEAKLRIHLRLVPRALPPAALGAVRRAAARPAAPARGQAADTPAARAARAAARRAGSVYRLVAGGHRRAAWWRSCAPRRRPPRRARPRPSCGYTCGSCRARCRPPRWELCAAPPPAPPRPPEAKLRIHLRLVPRALPPAALGAVRRAAARPAAPARGQAADTPAARAARAAARRAGSVYRLVAGGHRRAAWWRSCAPRRRPPRRARPRPSCGYTCGSCRARCRPPRWELCAAPPPAPPRPPEAKLRIHLRLVPRALPPAALGAVRRAAARPAAPARGQAADTPAARAARAAARRAGSVYRLVAGGHRRAAWWRSCAPRRRPPRRARPRPSCGYTCGSCRARCRPPRWELCAAPPPAPPRPPEAKLRIHLRLVPRALPPAALGQTPARRMVEELCAAPPPAPPRPPEAKLRIHLRLVPRALPPAALGQTPARRMVEELCAAPPPAPPRPPEAKLRIHLRLVPRALPPAALGQTPARRMVEELCAAPPPAPPRPPEAKLRIHLRLVPRALPPAALGAATAPPLRVRPARRPGRARPAAAAGVCPPPPPPPHGTAAAARLEARRLASLRRLAAANERRCWRLPLLGADLRRAVRAPPPPRPAPVRPPDQAALLERMHDVVDRFSVCWRSCVATTPTLEAGAGVGARDWRHAALAAEEAATPPARAALALLHAAASRQTVAFPHPRLLQFDCGKLQALAPLLRRLKAGGHRVLIFTQMTRVLDVLEAFLSLHGHAYARLDGATKVERRQALVERFNADARLFAFILSTRSGGVGLNLTGADCVIFYDSDWNPTMDAQAQDRCHRIGQTRDVHVFRLVTQATVEENILRKATEKRRLGELAIDDGHFTTSYLREASIKELFGSGADVAAGGDVESALAAAEDEQDAAAARAARAEQQGELAEFDEAVPLRDDDHPDHKDELATLMSQLTPIEKYAMRCVESSEAGCEAEREALSAVRRSLGDWERRRRRDADPESADAEPELTYSRRDADTKVRPRRRVAPPPSPPPSPCPTPAAGDDARDAPDTKETIDTKEKTDTKESAAKKAGTRATRSRGGVQIDLWRLDARRGRRPDRAERPALRNGTLDAWLAKPRPPDPVWLSGGRGARAERMPIWCPPSPPASDGDGELYRPPWARALYRAGPAPEHALPALPRARGAGGAGRAGLPAAPPLPQHPRLPRPPRAPPSLFERAGPGAGARVRVRPRAPADKHKDAPAPDWAPAEDAALRRALRLQRLPPDAPPARAPNWEWAAELVADVARAYRAPRACRDRHERLAAPDERDRQDRERDRQDRHQRRKQRKPGARRRPDDDAPRPPLARLDAMREAAERRRAAPKRRLDDAQQHNPKHAQLLADHGLDYDRPPTPMEVASRRADRIAKEKSKAAGAGPSGPPAPAAAPAPAPAPPLPLPAAA
ncbi:helicase domino, partial [Cydia splendana]|uniref:helicase domino n=1 Tax=Cydia splendana TaxID=1100963 RepID=UPI00300CE1CE